MQMQILGDRHVAYFESSVDQAAVHSHQVTRISWCHADHVFHKVPNHVHHGSRVFLICLHIFSHLLQDLFCPALYLLLAVFLYNYLSAIC